MKLLNLLFFFLLFSNVVVAQKELCENDFVVVVGIEYKISDIISKAGQFYSTKSFAISKFFKNFNTQFVINLFLLAWSGYIKSFDNEKPYLMKNEYAFVYQQAIKGFFLLRRNLFHDLNDCSFLHEIVYHADRDLLIFFMNRVIPKKKVYINLAYTSNYKSEAETLLDFARLMKSITKEKIGVEKYEKIETYLKNRGGLGEDELVSMLNGLRGKQKRVSRKKTIFECDKEKVIRCLLTFRTRVFIEKVCM